ncbi:tripartite tricarboxylate transporter substrate binding protein [Arthrobacter sp. NPDC089319]|uniref:Bug family tripartite tricarboxylate transporter substrate binding protein n=1 Tax=Arthrobacter sp. NPDC089319 TaxID=3155915 RepID=UPI00342B94A8
MKFRVASTIGLVGILGLSVTGCVAQGSADEGSFPQKPIHLSVPWGAGGGGDLNARTLAPILEEILDVDVIVENRPGASGSVGMEWLADQKPDGHTIGFVGAELASLQHLDYDIKPESLTPVAQIVSVQAAIAVPSDSKFKTLDDLVEAAKAKPGAVSYSNPGPGSIFEGTGNGFQQEAGITLASVPFDGSAPSVTAAVGGQVDVVIDNVGNIGPQVESGALRYLAVFAEERREDLPDVPTAKEHGIDLVNASWNGVAAPPETPEEVVATISDAFEQALKDPRFVEHAQKTDQDINYRDPAGLKTYLTEQADMYGKWLAK